VLPFAARIGKPEIHVFYVVVFNHLEDVFHVVRHRFIPFCDVRLSVKFRQAYSEGGMPSVIARRLLRAGSDRFRAFFPGADAQNLFDIGYENLSVADPAGMSGLLDRLDRVFNQIVFDDDFDFHFREEIDDIFGAPIKLGVAFLPPETLGFGYREALNADVVKSFLHFVELERLDNRLDFFHGFRASLLNLRPVNRPNADVSLDCRIRANYEAVCKARFFGILRA
jgi:hypothetical protein